MQLILIAPVLAASLAAPPDPSAIVDGQAVASCGWPSVVRLETAESTAPCSGTLVHPYIVATAAHCVFYWEFARVLFGESDQGGVFSTPIEFCEKNPEFPEDATTEAQWDNTDYAFCKLAQPVENVPIIPIAYGCELDAVEPGAELTVVGFGITHTMGSDVGTKRFGDTTITGLDAGELVVESVSCGGDSGGGYFMQLPGGELRQVGITSYGQSASCEDASVGTAASGLVPFVFETTGIDIAPCHAIDGSWAPHGSCGRVPLEPDVGGDGDYVEGCPTGALSGFQSTCGPGVGETPDDAAPTIAVISPESGQMFESEGGESAVPIEFELAADDGDGWGIAGVALVIERVDGASDTERRATPPFIWSTQLPNGAYYVRGVAEDYAGNSAESDWVSVGVGVPAPPPRDDEVETTGGGASSDEGGERTSTSTGVESEGDATGDDEASAGDDTEEAGCGCRSARGSGGAMVLVLLAAMRRRRAAIAG